MKYLISIKAFWSSRLRKETRVVGEELKGDVAVQTLGPSHGITDEKPPGWIRVHVPSYRVQWFVVEINNGIGQFDCRSVSRGFD